MASARANAAIMRNRLQAKASAPVEEPSPISIPPSQLESAFLEAASDNESVADVVVSARSAIEAARRQLGLPDLPAADACEGFSPSLLEELIL